MPQSMYDQVEVPQGAVRRQVSQQACRCPAHACVQVPTAMLYFFLNSLLILPT
jgi:hypothetical protein